LPRGRGLRLGRRLRQARLGLVRLIRRPAITDWRVAAEFRELGRYARLIQRPPGAVGVDPGEVLLEVALQAPAERVQGVWADVQRVLDHLGSQARSGWRRPRLARPTEVVG